MSIRINSNIASGNAVRRLGSSTAQLQSAFSRLSSGLRITKASDDAAGLAISSGLAIDAKVHSQAIRNINDGVSLLSIADGALEQMSAIVIRQRELAEQASNGVLGVAQRRALHSEANALIDEFNRIVRTVSFNNINLLDASTQTVSIQAGGDSLSTLTFGVSDSLDRSVSNGVYTQSSAIAFTSGGTQRGGYSLDINGDGKIDVLAVDSNNTMSVSLGNGNGTFAAPVSYGTESGPISVAVGDYNGDGLTDVVTADYSSANGVMSVLLGNGNGTFKLRSTYAAGTNAGNPTDPIAVDLNGDGILDIVTTSLNTSQFSVLIGNGNGSFKAVETYMTLTSPRSIGAFDMNNDGRLDLVMGRSGSGGFAVAFGNGDGTFGAATSYTISSTSARGTMYADVNLDGYVDVVTPMRNGTNGDAVEVWLNSGSGTFTTSTSFMAGGFGAFDVAETYVLDMNGDGIADIVTSNNVTASSSLLLGNGNGTFKLGTTTANAFGIPNMFADYNGDGVLDIGALGSPGYVFISGTQSTSEIGYVNLLSQSEARSAMDTLTTVLNRVNAERGANGAAQSRLAVALNNLSAAHEGALTAQDRIVSADVAEEAANLVKAKILQEAGIAVLAQANQQPTLALNLLRPIS